MIKFTAEQISNSMNEMLDENSKLKARIKELEEKIIPSRNSLLPNMLYLPLSLGQVYYIVDENHIYKAEIVGISISKYDIIYTDNHNYDFTAEEFFKQWNKIYFATIEEAEEFQRKNREEFEADIENDDILSIDEILNNYNEFGNYLFSGQFINFLTKEEIQRINMKIKEHLEWEPLEWTLDNILSFLQEGIFFGWKVACNQLDSSARIAYDLVIAWCKVLKDKKITHLSFPYNNYGKELFQAVATRYGWKLPANEKEY